MTDLGSDRLDAVVDARPGDLLGLTAVLCAVPSVSGTEEPLADAIEARLRLRAPTLTLDRIRHNVVARTDFGRSRRIVLGGHLDTVPANGNDQPRIEGDVVHGLGTADMKGGLAALLRLAEETAGGGAYDCTFVFYEGEEVAEEHNGLRLLFEVAPDVLAGDFAVLLEPTAGWMEAGCQGTIHLRASFRGERAHSARPWTGVNAIHRAAPVLARIAGHDAPVVEVDGLEYRESLQVVRVEAGVANNVVPDECVVVVNRRYAPAQSLDDALAETGALLAEADDLEVLNASPAAPPNLSNPLVADFVELLGLPVRPKLGWTDVARFAARGVPACNFGPGDPLLAHTAGEYVERSSLEQVHAALATFLGVI